ncbi:MAG: anti-sigma factor antagonist [Clostridia bacterium]|nr:anti-sigma factor antagonist [Clostridia bacterium]
MEYKVNREGGVLTLSLTGELDHHGAASARTSLDREIRLAAPKKVVLELSQVHFCDSSGLGLIMGRYRCATAAGAAFAVKDPSPAVERIMALAGLGKIIKTERSVKI